MFQINGKDDNFHSNSMNGLILFVSSALEY
jgi:hypothetical protein